MKFNTVAEVAEAKDKACREIEEVLNKLSLETGCFLDIEIRNCNIATVGLGAKHVHDCKIKVIL